jgi:hypothetical protein
MLKKEETSSCVSCWHPRMVLSRKEAFACQMNEINMQAPSPAADQVGIAARVFCPQDA